MKNIIKRKLVPREGAPFRKKDVPILEIALNEILAKKGSISAEDIVKKAKSKSSKIHRFFEWNGEVAAQGFRLQQARNIVNHFEFVITADNREPFRMPAFQSIVAVKGEPKVYLPSPKILSVDNYADQVVNRFISMIEGISSDLQGFREYAWMVSILDLTLQKVKKGMKKQTERNKKKK